LKIAGKNVWCIDIIDADTRYLLATKLSTNREKNDIKILMERARDRAGKTPKKVLTDGWVGYPDGIELAYGADAKHIVTEPFAGQENDNTELIERWHGTLKDRTKTLRGLKSIESANEFLDGYLIYYNYIRPHESLEGRTPAEKAKLVYPSKSWVEINHKATPQTKVLVTPRIVTITDEPSKTDRPLAHRHYNIERKNQLRTQNRIRNARKPSRALKYQPKTVS
jgi:hypothetical protein